MSWLDRFFGKNYNNLQNTGVPVPVQDTLNIIGATFANDTVNRRTTVTFTGGGGGFTPPTGTGVCSTTAGTLDLAARPVGSGFYTWMATPSSANLAACITDETGSGALVFGTAPLFKTTINLNNPGNTFKYIITPAAIAADRILTLPLLLAGDTMVTEAFTQTLTNKTINGANNTLTVRLASDVTGSLPGANMVAAGATAGSMSAADKTKLDALQPSYGGAISAYDIDWSQGTVFSKTLGAGAQVFTFSNTTGGRLIIVRVTGAASTLTWPTVKWAGGTPPTQTASGIDVYTFFHDGTSIYGSVVQDMS